MQPKRKALQEEERRRRREALVWDQVESGCCKVMFKRIVPVKDRYRLNSERSQILARSSKTWRDWSISKYYEDEGTSQRRCWVQSFAQRSVGADIEGTTVLSLTR